jgi:hypothetical protein
LPSGSRGFFRKIFRFLSFKLESKIQFQLFSMTHCRLAIHFSVFLALSTFLKAGFTYVDAVDGNSGNTTLSDGSPLFANDSSGSTTWRQRDDVAFGASGTIFEGIQPSPEIKTRISGLVAGKSYRIVAHFWDPDSTAEDWNIRAGFSSGNLITYTRVAGEVTGSLGSLLSSSLSYDLAPNLVASSSRSNLAAQLGTAVANDEGQIEVFIDDSNSANVNVRTWYDGVSYEASELPVEMRTTYVDASINNTTRWDALPFSPAPDSTTGADNNWEIRTLGNLSTVMESNNEAAEDAPLLVTSIRQLSPNTTYVIYAYFWRTSDNWRLKATVNPADINQNQTPDDRSDDFLPSSPRTHFAGTNHVSGTATLAKSASNTPFTATPLVVEANRTLMQASLGTATSDSSGKILVYIDDFANSDQSARTWYDGIGYKTALPLLANADEDGDGLDNGTESTLGTNPYISDSDGDTHTDGAEVAAGSDPLDPRSIPPLPGNSLQITADGVWTWFNDERAIFHEGALFTGYVKRNGQYGVTRYNLETNESFDMVISTGNSQQQDDHNNPSITIMPDGKLMILYAKHLGGSQFYQRTSLVNQPSSNSDWGPEIAHSLPANNTYNNTYILSDESNKIYNFHRCLNFNPTITRSDDLGKTWQSPVQFIEVGSNNVRPYPRYSSNKKDRIDLIYTDGHPRDVNNSIYHMFYRQGNFHKTDGTLIDSFANLPLDHQGGQRGSVIYQFSSSAWGPGQGPNDWIPNARGWTWDVHVAKDGKPVCVFQAQLGSDSTWSSSRIYYYYARWTGSEWQKRFIAQAGRGIYAAESDYGGGMTLDPENPNVVYISSNAANPFALDDINNVPLKTNARFEIYRGITRDGGITFDWEAITSNSEADNLRPIIPENHRFDHAVIWFNGTYTSYTNYNTRVLAILRNQLHIKTSSLSPSSKTGMLTWSSSPGFTYRITGSTDLAGFPHAAAEGIDSQGNTTTQAFVFPPPLHNSPNAFFRVETE